MKRNSRVGIAVTLLCILIWTRSHLHQAYENLKPSSAIVDNLNPHEGRLIFPTEASDKNGPSETFAKDPIPNHDSFEKSSGTEQDQSPASVSSPSVTGVTESLLDAVSVISDSWTSATQEPPADRLVASSAVPNAAPEASGKPPDKVVVMGKLATQDTTWVDEELPGYAYGYMSSFNSF